MSDSDIAIRVENLSKKFTIGHKKEADIRNAIGARFKRLFNKDTDRNESIWALKDISFEIKKGEAVGIIGRNGAGKSTLLKVLSRITEPTTGIFEINGRVSSLLEVGTGFHQELSGRENVYLNGTILGMKRSEIKSKFDEIVSFSGVGKFIDTPVKHYSSGMKVRLAFSVAAHLEPEILIIDEVLAVGDAEFQKKCLGKMGEVASEGRTVIFVSHNMTVVQNFCKKGLFLENGKVTQFGDVSETINLYSFGKKNDQFLIEAENLERTGHSSDVFRFTKLNMYNSEGEIDFYEKEEIYVDFWFDSDTEIKNLAFGISIKDSQGNNLIECRSFRKLPELTVGAQKNKKVSLKFSPNLKAGVYSVTVGAVSSLGSMDYLADVWTLEIKPDPNITDHWYNEDVGMFMVDHSWSIE